MLSYLFIFLSGWGSLNDITVVDVKYDEYAVIHTLKTKGDDVYSAVKLYGKVICKVRLCPVNSSQSVLHVLLHRPQS